MSETAIKSLGQFGRLNHVALAVPDLERAATLYRTMGATISPVQQLPEHGVSVIFIELANCKIELLHPLGDHSPIAAFLAKNPDGGMHHICIEVDDIDAAARTMAAEGLRLLNNGEPKIGAHGKPVLFIHPKDTSGTLIEIEEV